MMPSTSKTNRRKSKKPIPKPKQRWQVKQPTTNWLELPSDIMANILSRLGAFEILENAQKVCTTWRNICKDPAMWRVIYLENFSDPSARPELRKMCMLAVDRSQGQLVDISIVDFADDDLLLYIANRSSQLRRLACCYGDIYESLPEALKKFSLLEELSLHVIDISKEAIETAGRYCPLLKTLKVNQNGYRVEDIEYDEEAKKLCNESAIAIGQNLPELKHLELIGGEMSNIGLQAVLDGCRHLESLDLRACLNIDLKGDLGKRCSQQIKHLRLPSDSLAGHKYICDDSNLFSPPGSEIYLDDDDYDDDFGYSDYDEFSDYDDFTAFDDDFEDVNEMMSSMATMFW